MRHWLLVGLVGEDAALLGSGAAGFAAVPMQGFGGEQSNMAAFEMALVPWLAQQKASIDRC